MADISKITLPSGTTYNIKDQGARDLIDEMSGYTDFLGVTTTALTDGATTNPITINGASVTAKKGNIVTYGSAEFIFNGTAWQLFGDLSGLGDLAFKDSASGTVAVPKTYTTTVTPSTTSKYVALSATGGGSASKGIVDVKPASGGTATYTPAGSNAASSVTGSCSVTPSGSISVGTGTANYTPQGSNAASSVSGSCTVTPSGSISVGTGTANYTPAGTVSTPTITVTPSTVSKYVATSATGGGSVTAGTKASCTLPVLTTSVSNEVLTIGWSAGSFTQNTPTAVTLPSFSSQTIATGISSASSSQPTFTGTGKELKFTGSSSTGTISGTAAAQTFTGTGKELKFTGSSSTGTISGTAAAQTFTGTGARLVTDSEVYTSVTMPSFSSQTIATGISSASTTTATTENKTVTVT